MSAADDGRSLGQLVASATAEMSALVHEEIALAKAELRDDVRRALFGSSAAAIAGVLGFFALPLFSFAAVYGIHNLGIGLAWSFTIVGGAYVLLAGLLIWWARSKFRKLEPPKKSMASAKESAAMLSSVKPRPRTAQPEHPNVESVTRSSV